MRQSIGYVTLGFALLAGTATASAQTIITREVAAPQAGSLIVTQPAIVSPEPLAGTAAETFVAPPARTVETVETVQTTRPAHVVRHNVTRRQVVRSHTSNKSIVTSSRPSHQPIVGPTQRRTIYRTIVRENVVPAPTVVTEPAMVEPVYSAPAYSEIVQEPAYVPSPVVPAPVIAGQVGGPPVTVAQPYRYVYENDCILVVDPNTNIAISALPR